MQYLGRFQYYEAWLTSRDELDAYCRRYALGDLAAAEPPRLAVSCILLAMNGLRVDGVTVRSTSLPRHNHEALED